MRVAQIYRYPVKGFTPERLPQTTLTAGAGVPFDRACGFTSGNLPDPPVAGGWVPARTFLQLTVYPELARFKANLDETLPAVTITAPHGRQASGKLRQGADFSDLNDLIRSHFDAGPHAIPELHVQAPGRGHWDFTDTAVSLINLASVRELTGAAGADIDPLRFRGNLFLDGLEPWQEFSMIGRRFRIGDAEIEVTRPAMRCAATTVDPATADTAINVPAILRKLTGHLFCGVYARVVKSGDFSAGQNLEDLGIWDGNPAENLPVRTPPSEQWPRHLRIEASAGDNLVLQNPTDNWPLLPATAGDVIRVHPVSGSPRKSIQVRLQTDGLSDEMTVERHEALAALTSGEQVLASGPYPASSQR